MSPEELARKYMTPRAIELEQLDKYVRGTQYEGRKDWFDDASEVPLFERKPCVIYPITKSAIGSHTSFILGEGRWPTLTSATNEDDQEIDEEWGLNKDDSDIVDRFVNVVLVKYAQLQEVSTEFLGDAMGMRSAAAVLSIRKGRICVETMRASWCTPTLDELGECTKLVIRYPFIEDYFDDYKRQWTKRCLIYRREIDAVSDTVWKPAVALDSGKEPEWTIDTEKSKEHGLGFCPVIWYPFMRAATTDNVVDGVAIHESQLQEIDGLNIALSQKQRAAVSAGDPQLVEIGADEDHNPAPMGAQARTSIEARQGPDGKPQYGFSSNRRSRRGSARKRGAGVIWTYPNTQTKVAYLTIPGDALKAIDDHAKDMRSKIAESMNAVFIDPAELKMHAALSGKALSFMFQRQLSFDDKVRSDFANKALVPLVSMLLRMVFVIGKKNPKGLYIPGVKKVVPVLARFEREMVDDAGNVIAGQTVWMPPRIAPVWGPYFAPNEQDQLAVAQLAIQTFQAGLCTREQAIEKLASSGVFDVGSAAEIVEAIVKEQDETEQRKQAALHDAMAKMNGVPGVPGGAKGTPPKAKPKEKVPDAA